jgi:hypothetical protein
LTLGSAGAPLGDAVSSLNSALAAIFWAKFDFSVGWVSWRKTSPPNDAALVGLDKVGLINAQV